MSSRRSHSKSRRGCQQCKQRKTKCDETKPVCLRCVRKGDICSYTHSSLVIIPSYSGLPGRPSDEKEEIPSESITPLLDTERGSDPEVDFASRYVLRGDSNDTLRLIHHYALSTSKSVADTDDQLPIWQNIIPALAFQHDFLLSGLLAITSLHLTLLRPSKEHCNAALQHYTHALALYRPQLTAITADNVSALFTFSILAALYSFGIHNTPLSKLSPLLEIQEIFELLRGVAIVVCAGAHWLEQGPLSSFMLPEPTNPLASLVAPGLESTFARLAICTQETPMDTSLREVYTKTIALLRQSFIHSQDSQTPTMVVLTFPIFAPLEFLSGVKNEEPLALIILAHYAILLHRWRRLLWLEGWGEYIVNAVRQVLGEKWRQSLEWPVAQIENRTQTNS